MVKFGPVISEKEKKYKKFIDGRTNKQTEGRETSGDR